MPIDRKKIIDDLSKIEVIGGDNGLIESFNVFVNQLPTAFWTGFAERLLGKTGRDLLSETEYLLTNAAQECGYHTGYGIITSEEWKAVVEPMVETVEDVLHGAFAVFTAFGWANVEIIELEPGVRMIVRAYDYYEADSVKIGKTNKKSAYLIRGVSAAFMALAYSGDYTTDGSKVNDYCCKQVKGIECGDDYGEFIVEKTTDIL